MAGIADPLREYARQDGELDACTVIWLDEHASRIEREHERRMEQCKRDVRRDFARFMRSVIADYEKGVSRRNRNHAHRKVRLTDDATGHTTCAKCGCRIDPYDNFCRHCGAKLTATEYEGKR